MVALGFIWFNFLLRKNAPLPAKTPRWPPAGRACKYTPAVQPTRRHPSDALPLPAAASTLDHHQGGRVSAADPGLFWRWHGERDGDCVRAHSVFPCRVMPIPTLARPSERPAPAPNTPQSNLAQQLKPTVLSGATACVIKNPDMVVTEGTVIPCILQTAIDTQLAGFVTCVVPIDVRGTTAMSCCWTAAPRIVGQIQTGLVQGQERVFVLWTRAETPKHVVISLNSPGADELGRAGLPGAVDNHWWQRFGGALMLTLVQGSLNAGTALAANSGSGSNEAALGLCLWRAELRPAGRQYRS